MRKGWRMDWGRRLLMKMEATAHNIKSMAEAIDFECGLVVGRCVDDLDDRLEYNLTVMEMLCAFWAYIDTGDLDTWDETAEVSRHVLAEIGADLK